MKHMKEHQSDLKACESKLLQIANLNDEIHAICIRYSDDQENERSFFAKQAQIARNRARDYYSSLIKRSDSEILIDLKAKQKEIEAKIAASKQ